MNIFKSEDFQIVLELINTNKFREALEILNKLLNNMIDSQNCLQK